MMIAIWFVAGCLAVAVPFYIFHDPFDLWSSLHAAGIGGTIYLFAFLYYLSKTEITMKFRILAGSLIGVFLVANGVYWSTADKMSAYQRALLSKIRLVIGEGILVSEDVTERGMPVFASYHKQTGKKKGIVTLFKEMHGKKMKDDMFPGPYIETDPSKRFVYFYGDTAVVLVSVDTVARGREELFVNANGNTGRLQTTTRITARGVDYERNN
ncbi:MAG: hypothetical protein HYV29_01945 [Ignavibacteriales bacterium]|nr:hypothetical protein [Ignavibacteriales bacterium]